MLFKIFSKHFYIFAFVNGIQSFYFPNESWLVYQRDIKFYLLIYYSIVISPNSSSVKTTYLQDKNKDGYMKQNN